MKFQNKAILIVGAYSTGAFYAPNFTARGYPCIHLHPYPDVGAFFLSSFRPQDFVKDLTWRDDLAALRAELQDYDVQHILPGSEAGVQLADQLNEAFGLPTANDFALSAARRNKYRMQEALQAAGLPSIAHFKSDRLGDIFDWMTRCRIPYPIVLKPLESAGTDNVFICEDAAAARRAFGTILHSDNLFHMRNREVLAQAYVKGDEYVVNTVSHAGRHHVTEVIQVHKRRIHNAPVYDCACLLDPAEHPDVFDKLRAHIPLVLDALGIRHGPGHSELMMDGDGPPVLIETAARPIGGIDPSAYTRALGYNHMSATVEAYVNPERFRRLIEPPALRRRLLCVFLISPLRGEIRRRPDLRRIRALGTFHSLVLQDSGLLEETRSLVNCPGYVTLVGDDMAALMDDYAQVRGLEGGMFAQMLCSEAEAEAGPETDRVPQAHTPARLVAVPL